MKTRLAAALIAGVALTVSSCSTATDDRQGPTGAALSPTGVTSSPAGAESTESVDATPSPTVADAPPSLEDGRVAAAHGVDSSDTAGEHDSYLGIRYWMPVGARLTFEGETDGSGAITRTYVWGDIAMSLAVADGLCTATPQQCADDWSEVRSAEGREAEAVEIPGVPGLTSYVLVEPWTEGDTDLQLMMAAVPAPEGLIIFSGGPNSDASEFLGVVASARNSGG